jgi:hypothetical protein
MCGHKGDVLPGEWRELPNEKFMIYTLHQYSSVRTPEMQRMWFKAGTVVGSRKVYLVNYVILQ